jgi:DNA-binding MarR family transcriptional regulator/GNAT superfamily N-acetyltransferase
LTEARVLFELAQQEVLESLRLRERLDIDPGYLSRILKRFEARGLVIIARAPNDARRRIVSLTSEGRGAFGDLDARADSQVEAMMAPVPRRRRSDLVTALKAAQEVFQSPRESPTVVLREPAPGDLGWVIHAHGAVYAREFGWDETFEGLVARIVVDYMNEHDPQRERAWIAELENEPVGCIFCVRGDGSAARLRLLLVEPDARGLGVGRRLVDECVRFARRTGYESLILWTNDVLVAARQIYEEAGFRLVRSEPHHSFGAELVGQDWLLDLGDQ